MIGKIPFRLSIGTRIPSRTLFETGQYDITILMKNSIKIITEQEREGMLARRSPKKVSEVSL